MKMMRLYKNTLLYYISDLLTKCEVTTVVSISSIYSRFIHSDSFPNYIIDVSSHSLSGPQIFSVCVTLSYTVHMFMYMLFLIIISKYTIKRRKRHLPRFHIRTHICTCIQYRLKGQCYYCTVQCTCSNRNEDVELTVN